MLLCSAAYDADRFRRLVHELAEALTATHGYLHVCQLLEGRSNPAGLAGLYEAIRKVIGLAKLYASCALWVPGSRSMRGASIASAQASMWVEFNSLLA